jgi:hypothetical protein
MSLNMSTNFRLHLNQTKHLERKVNFDESLRMKNFFSLAISWLFFCMDIDLRNTTQNTSTEILQNCSMNLLFIII